MLDDLSNAHLVFFPIFLGTLALCSVIETAAPGKCPGFKLVPSHAAKHSLNMPFGAAKHHDLSKIRYSNFQLFRISLGIIFSTMFLIAGWIGGKSGILAEHSELEKFASTSFFNAGALFLFLHTQMTWERLHNGAQLVADIRGLIPCVLTRSIIARYTYVWITRVLNEVDGVMETMNGLVMVVAASIALVIFVLVDVIRLVVMTTQGQQASFTPSVVIKKEKE